MGRQRHRAERGSRSRTHTRQGLEKAVPCCSGFQPLPLLQKALGPPLWAVKRSIAKMNVSPMGNHAGCGGAYYCHPRGGKRGEGGAGRADCFQGHPGGSGYSWRGSWLLSLPTQNTLPSLLGKKKKKERFIRELMNKRKKILVCLLIIEEWLLC